ncbi:rRNA maturation RNase YbeY [Chakrabartyella piscis]|uniref:rRNA maturation RNase YbeY n=1 Tax=Chakrabartyella piscis TaxID=2918914 RepID=UPI002958CB23|nr:rRNA maturation RNase YbeY [Chakrabartyella piscis]
MTILIDSRVEDTIELEWTVAMERMVLEALAYENFQEPCEISISIVDNVEIQQINKQFRNIDKPTDVLSFPLLTFAEDEVMERNEKDEVMLGDIIISLERAREQAEEYGHSMLREMAFLTAHSMFHLLGYDHMTEEEEIEMFAKQNAILEIANIGR